MVAEIVDITNKRKLVTVRIINAVNPIEGADAIEVVTVDGWKIVVKKGEFKVGDQCVYLEIDSFLPDGNEAWQFLVDKSPRMFEGVKGHKLRTIKLRGQVSQGLVLRVEQVPAISEAVDYLLSLDAEADIRSVDFSDALGIKKWEAPLPACLAGQAAGFFPSFIRKTDQERCQNLKADIFGYDPIVRPGSDWIDITVGQPADGQVIQGQSDSGQWEEAWDSAEPTGAMTHWRPLVTVPARASRDDRYEITLKLDGSSMTAFARAQFTEPVTDEDGVVQNPIQLGVCSRNLELKINEENKDNSFVKMAIGTNLLKVLEELAEEGLELAVQGELMGPNIQGNREALGSHQFYVFDIFDIRESQYLAPARRQELFNRMRSMGANIHHAPVLYAAATLIELNLTSIDDLLAFAEGPSITNKVREGLVFKRLDGQFSWKAISNKFLAGEKD